MESEFEVFVHSTGSQFYRAALLLTGGDHHLAEDLTQMTYAKVFTSWERTSHADDPVAYARSILTRTFLSHRRLRRSSERPTESLPESAVPTESGDRLDLIAALRQLRPRDRAVVVHRYWLDRSVAETAQDLALSESAIRTISRRALARLRVHLTDIDDEDD